jgi:uncharacterized cupredoxin-like copper-binding protein
VNPIRPRVRIGGVHPRRHRAALVSAGAAVALALAGAAMAAIAGGRATHKSAITITEREYHIALSTKTVPAGTVTFTVHNVGKLVHKLDIAGAGLKSTVRVPSIAPGRTRSVTVSLAGGTLSLWCPVPGHAALGMKASLKVSGGSTSTGVSPAPATTTTGSTWG